MKTDVLAAYIYSLDDLEDMKKKMLIAVLKKDHLFNIKEHKNSDVDDARMWSLTLSLNSDL